MELQVILNFILQHLIPDSLYLEYLDHIYGRGLNTMSCVALVTYVKQLTK
jgi:hypothetical protein